MFIAPRTQAKIPQYLNDSKVKISLNQPPGQFSLWLAMFERERGLLLVIQGTNKTKRAVSCWSGPKNSRLTMNYCVGILCFLLYLKDLYTLKMLSVYLYQETQNQI